MASTMSRKEREKVPHIQLMSYLRERILDGRLPAGTRLPTDVELAAEHQVSRDAIRQALGLLVHEGLIERVQGRGTFVCQPPLNQNPLEQPRQKHIGLVLDRTPFAQLSTDLLIGIEQAAKSHGYSVSFTYSEGDQEQQARDIARLRNNQVQGFIIYPMGDATYDVSIQQLQAAHVPVVLIDRYFPDLDADYVGLDNIGGGYRATEHLLILGHRRIGFVYSPDETLQTTSVRERWQGYCNALQKYGIPYDETLIVPNYKKLQATDPDGYERFLGQLERPTAIFAVNDYVALDVMQAAHDHHLRIPEDLALIGFDDSSFAAYLSPPLTTVAQPFIDVGMRAVNLLISRIEGNGGSPKHIELPTNFIIRGSCGAHLHVKKSLSLE